MDYVRTLKQFFWMPLRPNTFSTMSILRVLLKPNTFRVSFPDMIMIANVFTSQKHQISKKNTKKNVLGFETKLKNDVTRQAKCVGDSYIAASTRSPRCINY